MMNKDELSEEEKKQVFYLLISTLKGEQFTSSTFDGLSKKSVQFYIQLMENVLNKK